MKYSITTSVLLSTIVAIAGCDVQPDISALQQHESSNTSNATGPTLKLSKVYSDNKVKVLPTTKHLLPHGASQLHYEGNGWVTFMWKGGCYIGSTQYAGSNGAYQTRFTMTHNVDICNDNIDPTTPKTYTHRAY